MKQLAVFCSLLFCCILNAQVQRLSELSSGVYQDMVVIKEEDKGDVYGYCFLYQTNHRSKEVFDLEYVVLDKNLNKLTSFKITQAVYQSTFFSTHTKFDFISKIGEQLLIGVADNYGKPGEESIFPDFNARYVTLNLNDFSVSKLFRYVDSKRQEVDYKEGDKVKVEEVRSLQTLVSTQTDRFLLFSLPEFKKKFPASIAGEMEFYYKKSASIKHFDVLDKDLNTVWGKDINGNEGEAFSYKYFGSDNDVLLLKKDVFIKKKNRKDVDRIATNAMQVYDIKNGNLLGEINFNDDKYHFNYYNLKIVGDKIHILTCMFEKTERAYINGYAHLVYDKTTVKELARDYILYKDFAEAVPGLKEFGVITDDELLAEQDFVINEKGNLLLILETFGTKWESSFLANTETRYVEVKDLYLVELSPDKKVVFSKKIEKHDAHEIGANWSYITMRVNGLFGYRFKQNINRNGGFALYYTQNDKGGTNHEIIKNRRTSLGVVTYIDGEYGFEALKLYKDKTRIYTYPAKNGYILLNEVNTETKEVEIRLERINY